MCGGTLSSQARNQVLTGLSPRVRGNRPALLFRQLRDRSIPACAGEPQSLRRRRESPSVYPRVCGGTGDQRRRRIGLGGLSPRLRGNLRLLLNRSPYSGSIPACAGEPRNGRKAWDRNPVYPRVCGGTHTTIWACSSPAGLSPRVRGNPTLPLAKGRPTKVYPRVCGGTP